jgi:hypothetical protein
MKVIMNDLRLINISQIKAFLQGSQIVNLNLNTIEEKYQFILETVEKFNYKKLNRKDKKVILKYLKKLTGYQKAQLFKLVKKALITGKLLRVEYHRNNSFKVYKTQDIKYLEKTDELHLRLSSQATKEILRREYAVFNHQEFKNISQISSSHINNLRKTDSYKSFWVNGTKARQIDIGKTQPPEANLCPGSIRVDTVHQRDVYYINSVDEITQWEIIICVPQISERFLKPALQVLLKEYPFVIFNFHSDRGSEFINKIVAQILNKLLITQTKSRSRHCNDNALVESKNGSIIRKNLGYFHVSQKMANKINSYMITYFNPYLNYHRPCGYVTQTKVDKFGREKKIYGQYTTPYEKLKEVTKRLKKNFLKPGIDFKDLDKIAYLMSDNEYAKILREKQSELVNLNIAIEHEIIDLGSKQL